MRAWSGASAAAWAVAALIVGSGPPAAGGSILIDFPDGRPATRIETRQGDGVTYLRLADLARGAGGARHWNATNGKMTLTIGPRRIAMTSGNPLTTLDATVLNVGHPVLLSDGDFWVPESFLRHALAPAMNAEVVNTEGEGEYRFAKLGPVVTSIGIDERSDGTAVVFGLNELADFVAESAERGAIQVIVPGGRLIDTLAVLEGAGLVSSVAATGGGDGVIADIRVDAGATSFEAGLYHDPYRIEILVGSGQDASYMTPALKERRGLLPTGRDILAVREGEVETVMIDPGHGGRDRGAVGSSGLVEKDVTLALAEELSRILQRDGFYVFMTRSSDSYVQLKRRAELANLAGADVFVSLQADAWYSRAASGFGVAYHAPPAVRMRPHGLSRGAGLKYVEGAGVARNESGLEWAHVQDAFRDESRRLAGAVHERMAADLESPDRGVSSRSLSVLSGCAMPAIVIEVGFMSNGGDEERLADEGSTTSAARAIARGIADYRRSQRGGD
jgi:N-acetylmuramoyl-L-alanine amidase